VTTGNLYSISISSDKKITPLAEFKYQWYDTRAIWNKKKSWELEKLILDLYIHAINARTLGIVAKTKHKVVNALKKIKPENKD
jgi:hypothetical protein